MFCFKNCFDLLLWEKIVSLKFDLFWVTEGSEQGLLEIPTFLCFILSFSISGFIFLFNFFLIGGTLIQPSYLVSCISIIWVLVLSNTLKCFAEMFCCILKGLCYSLTQECFKRVEIENSDLQIWKIFFSYFELIFWFQW